MRFGCREEILIHLTAQMHGEADPCMRQPHDSAPDAEIAPKVGTYRIRSTEEKVERTEHEGKRDASQCDIRRGSTRAGSEVRVIKSDAGHGTHGQRGECNSEVVMHAPPKAARDMAPHSERLFARHPERDLSVSNGGRKLSDGQPPGANSGK